MINTSEFSTGMTVLAIDDDLVALRHMESMLKQCRYQAICTSEAITALELLKDSKFKLDLIISDVDVSGIDGHKFFENLLNINTELPIILLSKERSKELLMQRVTRGACEFLIKPVRIDEVQNIWRHVIRRRNNSNPKAFSKIENFDNIPKSCKNGKRKHEENGKHRPKKSRVVWTQDLHYKFVAAVDKLGHDKAVPKKIMELMNGENLTRENVASHLQKYRIFLKKSSENANTVTTCGNEVDSAYDQNFSGFNNMQSIAGNMNIYHPVLANSGNSTGQVHSSSSTSDCYNPSTFIDLSGFQDNSLTSCVTTLPKLHHQTQPFSYMVDHNMTTQYMGYATNGLNSEFSNQLDQALSSNPGLFSGKSAFPIINDTSGLVRETNLDDDELDCDELDELIRVLCMGEQEMNSHNTDQVDDVTKKDESHIQYSTSNWC